MRKGMIALSLFATLALPSIVLADDVAAGAAAGATTGAVTGAVVGGPVGAVVGGAVGAGVGAGAGAGAAADRDRGTVTERTCVEDSYGDKRCRETVR